MARPLATLLVVLAGCARPTQAPTRPPAPASDRAPASKGPRLEPFSIRSERLSAFAGHEVRFEAMVLTPPDHDPACASPTLYFVHGFGSSALQIAAGYTGDVLLRDEADPAPPLIRVFVDANHPLGHHVFADSENTGPSAAPGASPPIPSTSTASPTSISTGRRACTGPTTGPRSRSAAAAMRSS